MARIRTSRVGVHRPSERRDDTVSSSGVRDEEQQIASGRPSSTPFVVVGVVAMAIWGVVALVVALVFLVFWLA
ncbi:MAG: hypothetical protein E6G28_07100 [Actinobacteria bacterium]|nr:MAG: hypothetical protein E6G28_07100 [Actinomycetota bacterium]